MARCCRLHTHFEVDRSVPVRVDVTRKAGGEADDRAVLKRCIEPDRTYMLDRHQPSRRAG